MTDYRATVTPADVEFVLATDLVVGDVLVHFTAIGRDVSIPPTTTQLRRRRTAYVPILTIDHDVTPHQKRVIELNVADPSTRETIARDLGVRVWRVKR